MKHIFNLTKEEKAMEAQVNRADIRPITKAEVTYLQQVARNTFSKNKTITVRVSERNLMRLKAAAAREGVPYQTLISSLIHKHI